MTDDFDGIFNSAGSPVEAGGMIVMMKPDMKPSSAIKKLEKSSGRKVASSSDFSTESEDIGSELGGDGALFLETLRLAVVEDADPERMSAMATALEDDGMVMSMRPEYMMYPLETMQEAHRAWLAEGARILAGMTPADLTELRSPGIPAPFLASSAATWGVRAVRADRSPFTGKGIKIAILDTGFGTQHV